MRQMRMPQTTAGSGEEYEEIAVRLAEDSPWRQSLAARLKAAHAADERPYLDTRSLSQRVGRGLEELHAKYETHYAQLSALPFEELMQATARLLPPGPDLEPGLASFNDVAIVHNLVEPFFRGRTEPRETRCMLDVGACFGQMALPFLAQGWEVHLFEPDPECRRVLGENVAEHAGARIVPAAVTSAGAATVRFHQSRVRGLSGLAASPYGETEAVIEVPGLRLADYCREHRIERVDFLKIDAEGHDFDVLASLDPARLKPRLVMLEFGTVFAGQPLAEVNRVMAAMKEHGYRTVAFCGDDEGSFRRGDWSYELRRILLDAPLPEQAREVFGNLLFFRQDDRDFLLALHALLDCARPRRQFLERDGGAAQD
jgi:FkbM family methyltransferase